MRLGQVDFPSELVDAAREGKLVVFAGAGVSMGAPANLPSFWKLVSQIASGTGQVKIDHEPADRFLGRLAHQKLKVHHRAAELLTISSSRPTALHRDLLRLFKGPRDVRIVTTNFDLHFESAANEIWSEKPKVFSAPALPLGEAFVGIVHVHGALPDQSSLVLTDGDFGRAYLTEGWARRFLVAVFQHYSVLFVGYSHEDVVLQYLARALPGSQLGRRYVLDKSTADPKQWNLLGIDLIPFPGHAADDYTELYDGVHRLAELCGREVLDWQREISGIAQQLPPVSIELADLLRHALRDTAFTRFFTAAARHAEWLQWLDENEVLRPLFSADPLDDHSEILAAWIARWFAIPFSSQCFLLIGRHHVKLNQKFWWMLARHIASEKEQTLSAAALAKWISVLSYSAPAEPDSFILHWLAERCAKEQQFTAALTMFELMLRGRLIIKKPFAWRAETTVEDSHPLVEIGVGEHWEINEVWEKCLKPNLNVLAEPVLDLALKELEVRHSTFHLWEQWDDRWDADSYRRAAIEPHEQNRHPTAIDVLIDAARDALEWIAAERNTELVAWYSRLIGSKVPLIRRLAVHAIRFDPKTSADEKVSWLLGNNLHDLNLRHEMFALARDVYGSSSAPARRRILDEVASYRWPDAADDDHERRGAIEKYQWLHWISEADPSCSLAAAAKAQLKTDFPTLAARPYPDLTHWTGGADWVGSRSPWSVDQLLGREPNNWCQELLDFKPTDPLGPDERGLAEAISEATRQNVGWGLALAESLAYRAAWETYIWDALLRAWSNWPEDVEAARKILSCAGITQVQRLHARSVADLLHALVRDGGKNYSPALLETSNAIATSTWHLVEREGEDIEPISDWIQSAINHAAGISAEYWVNALSIAIREKKVSGLEAEYLIAFNAIIDDEALAGRYALPILASQLPFLLSLNEEWIVQRFLPFFMTSNNRFQQAWHGLLWARLNRRVVALLAPAFLGALPKLKDELKSRNQRFVEYYVSAMALYIEKPTEEWIPKFFQHTEIDLRPAFALYLEHMLRGLDENRQEHWWNAWLKRYWIGRTQGSPAPLDASEVEAMLDWLPHLPAVFPDAVKIAIQMPPCQLQRSHLIYELKESTLVSLYPEAIGLIVCFLLDCICPAWFFYDIEPLLQKLGQQNLSEALRTTLIGKLVMRGIDATGLGW